MNNHHPLRPLVIFADDDKDLLLLVKIKLTAAGLDVKLCLNGENICAMATTEKPDVILLDISMQGANGGDICWQLKHNKDTSAIPIILMSANENIEHIANFCGADDYVSKPFNSATVQRKIENLLAA